MKPLSVYVLAINRAFRKYSVMIFLLMVTAGLVVVILSSAEIVNEALSAPAQQTVNGGSVDLDQNTINKLNELQSPSNPGSIQLPEGRINPFSE